MNWKTLAIAATLGLASAHPVFVDSHKTKGRLTAELTFSSTANIPMATFTKAIWKLSGQVYSLPWILTTTSA